MKELVMSQEEILDACKRIGSELTKRLSKEEKLPLFICVMRGALNFMADLQKFVDLDILVDYVQVSSYEGTSSTGKIHFARDVSIDVKDRVVVLVEDVVDTGVTMKFLKKHFVDMGPKEVLVVSLFDKRAERVVEVEADYVGKTLTEPKFLLGYGLDYNDIGRNVPYVYIPTEEEIAAFDKKRAK
ncbi:MAG: hypoxanthine phosphoribosyltransferase [Bacilli bacterium]|nr:hypoxanthine phosphoribosyltransferase [Bacilli bacterium]